jgi:hypothetical protein
MEVFRDWQSILGVWKRQHSSGKKLFQRVAIARTARGAPGLVEDQLGTQIVLSQRQDRWEVDDMGLTVLQREAFKYKCADAQKTRVDSIADEMRQRWKMDSLYEEYEKLEKEMRNRDLGTGARGRRYNTIAKEHLFSIAFESDDGRKPTKESDPDLWVVFGQLLDWGKRWNMMKSCFGSVGIFGLLPKSMTANTWVERQLTQTRVAQWIEMIAECNKDVAAMASRIEPLFLACIEESKLLAKFLFLEQLDYYRAVYPITLFN